VAATSRVTADGPAPYRPTAPVLDGVDSAENGLNAGWLSTSGFDDVGMLSAFTVAKVEATYADADTFADQGGR
jgi:hypothetical protein